MPGINLEALFRHHPPMGDQAERYETIRNAGWHFALVIQEMTPPSAEQTLAIRALHLAVMHANTAIACNENVATPA